MTRWLIFAAILTATPTITDMIVDYQFRHQVEQHPDQNIGYSKHDREGLERLIEDAKTKAAPERSIRMSKTHKAAVLADVWGITPEDLDKPSDIFGRGR
ncbi:hypothetical protein [Zavarzinella formosa]|uniref:hypothetical protein n=1 Tax=Zavarzinella formosa TaxID=360055 RepID=UPI0002F11985|nr:hypothetical protein [Zavarzinella formosa]